MLRYGCPGCPRPLGAEGLVGLVAQAPVAEGLAAPVAEGLVGLVAQAVLTVSNRENPSHSQ